MSQAMDYRAVRDQSDSSELAYEGMTAKQYAYCYERAAGHNQTEAYRRAYPGINMTADQIGIAASRLERDARVSGKIKRLLAASREQSSSVPQVEREERIEITRDWVGQGIARLAQDKTVKAQTRLSAYIAAGKLAGVDAFREIIVHDKRTRTVEEIDREIARHLANMIDVTPNAAPLPAIEQSSETVTVTPNSRDRRRKPVA